MVVSLPAGGGIVCRTITTGFKGPMPDFEYQGHTIHYESTGRGEPLVLLHCGGSAGRHWDRTAEYLADRYRLITPDFCGGGATARWRGYAVLSQDDHARLVAAVIRREVDGVAIIPKPGG